MSLAFTTRRLVSVASRRTAPLLFRATLATKTDAINLPEHEVVKKENPEGPMLGGYEDFLDDMIAKTKDLEGSMDAFKETYDKKKEVVNTVKWMDPDEIEGLFDVAGRQKREMEEQLQAVKQTLEAAHTNYAVDGPDGENDGHLEDEMEEVKHLIEDAVAGVDALKETYDKKRDMMMKDQTVKWMDPDEIEGLFDLAGRQKREMEEQLQEMKKTLEAAHTNFAVDGPDGFSDGYLEEEMEEVKHIIDDAAKAKKAA